MSGQFADGDGLRERIIQAANSRYGTDSVHTLIVDAVLPTVEEAIFGASIEDRNAEQDKHMLDGAERVIDAVRKVHHPGHGNLEPGAWCVADADEWPCATIRALADLTQEAGHG